MKKLHPQFLLEHRQFLLEHRQFPRGYRRVLLSTCRKKPHLMGHLLEFLMLEHLPELPPRFLLVLLPELPRYHDQFPPALLRELPWNPAVIFQVTLGIQGLIFQAQVLFPHGQGAKSFTRTGIEKVKFPFLMKGATRLLRQPMHHLPLPNLQQYHLFLHEFLPRQLERQQFPPAQQRRHLFPHAPLTSPHVQLSLPQGLLLALSLPFLPELPLFLAEQRRGQQWQSRLAGLTQSQVSKPNLRRPSADSVSSYVVQSEIKSMRSKMLLLLNQLPLWMKMLMWLLWQKSRRTCKQRLLPKPMKTVLPCVIRKRN